MAKAQALGLEPIERLEEKVRLLVGLLDKLRSDQASLTEENRHLRSQVEELRDRLSAAESASGELTALRQERDAVRARVAEILDHLEGLEV
jgi:regulator of replication initiation timing